MLRIILIRPGTTEFDQQGRILGTLDVPLSEQGSTEVADTIDQLRNEQISALYTSPSESAEQTSELVADTLGIRYKAVDLLQNVNHGLWQGMLVDEVKRKQPKVYRQWIDHPETVCPPEGEMVAAARKRVESVLGKLLKKHRTGTVGLVAPEPLASLIESVLAQRDIRDLLKGSASCGSWDVIEVPRASLSNV